MTAGQDADVDIGVLSTPDELRRLVTLFNQVWGSITPIVGVELLRAISHGGGYVAAASHDDQIVGGSLGFLARH
ncbi:MAG: GNAT family N-acetyltransferase, partial [Actinomycetota bacterium]|nr:GNAT family N-acetyltransferase [Actinomycetota bacterium]